MNYNYMLYKLVLYMFRNNYIQNDWRYNTSIIIIIYNVL